MDPSRQGRKRVRERSKDIVLLDSLDQVAELDEPVGRNDVKRRHSAKLEDGLETKVMGVGCGRNITPLVEKFSQECREIWKRWHADTHPLPEISGLDSPPSYSEASVSETLRTELSVLATEPNDSVVVRVPGVELTNRQRNSIIGQLDISVPAPASLKLGVSPLSRAKIRISKPLLFSVALVSVISLSLLVSWYRSTPRK
jgi:hypothetical protein